MRQDRGVNPSTALATVLVDELVRGGVREAVLCPGSRSAPLAYALQEADAAGAAAAARPGRRALRRLPRPRARQLTGAPCRWSRRRARPSPTCTRPCSRPTTPGCRCWCSAPTGRTSCAAPAPTRPPTSPASSARRSGGRTTSRRRRAAPGLNGPVALGRLPGPVPRRGATCRRRRAGAPQRAAARAAGAERRDRGRRAGVAATDAAGASRPDGEPWVRCPGVSRAPGAATSPRPPRGPWSSSATCARPAMAAEAVELARAAGWPVVAEPFGRYGRAAVVPHGPAAAHRHRLAGGAPARTGSLVVGRPTLSRTVAALLRHPGRAGRGGRDRAPTGPTPRTSRRACSPLAPARLGARPRRLRGPRLGRRLADGRAAGAPRPLPRSRRARWPSAAPPWPSRSLRAAQRARRARSSARRNPVRDLDLAVGRRAVADAGAWPTGAGRHRRLRLHRGRHRPRRAGRPDATR